MVSRHYLIGFTVFAILLLSLSAFAVIGAPANDHFANAQVLSLPYSGITPMMDTATIESGEPVHGCRIYGEHTGLNSVWFTFTLPQNGVAQLSTDGSNFVPNGNSILSIYTGSSLETLTEVGCHDDISVHNHYSALDIFLPAGTYFIKVSNWYSQTPLGTGSTLQLSVNFTPGIIPSITPTASQTPTATLTPTNTSVTSTPQASATPTATQPVNLELIINGDFEVDMDGNKIPDQWTPQGLYKDKQICNKPDKIVAYSGSCAFKFKGTPGEKSELRQMSQVVGVPPGTPLTLTIAANTSITVPMKLVVAKLQYQESDTGRKQNGKDKLKIKLSAATNGYRVFNGVMLTDGTLKNVLVRIPFERNSGKIILDALSLKATLP